LCRRRYHDRLHTDRRTAVYWSSSRRRHSDRQQFDNLEGRLTGTSTPTSPGTASQRTIRLGRRRDDQIVPGQQCSGANGRNNHREAGRFVYSFGQYGRGDLLSSKKTAQRLHPRTGGNAVSGRRHRASSTRPATTSTTLRRAGSPAPSLPTSRGNSFSATTRRGGPGGDRDDHLYQGNNARGANWWNNRRRPTGRTLDNGGGHVLRAGDCPRPAHPDRRTARLCGRR